MTELCTRIILALKEKGLSLSVAESCTGGLIAKALTDVSGASEVFFGGVVSYVNSVKEGVLGVNPKTLNKYGAVSEWTACEMAQGVRAITKSDIGISTTGLAGPGGALPDKPIGTVFIGFSDKVSTESHLLQIDPSLSREEIRQRALEGAMSILLEKITENY